MSKVWAHRGASAYAPENTMEAFRLAHKMGADGIELDVHLTRDGELVVIHDETVDRTSNGQGCIKDMTLAELKKLDFSMGKEGYQGARIPTLAEVYEFLKGTELSLNVEIKCDVVYYEGIVEKLCELTRKMGVEERILYSSFNHYVLLEMRKCDPACRIGLLYECGIVEPWEYAKKLHADALHPWYPALRTEGVIALCKQAGIPIHTWTVNEEAHMKLLFDAGVEAIITNYPDVALRIKNNDARA